MHANASTPELSETDQSSDTTPSLTLETLRPTLLIVDDEEGPRQSLAVIFKTDFNVMTADDGPSAIEIAQSNEVEVAILDIRMAGMSGIELLERLKFVQPGTEVIMMTAFETPETMRQALRLQACDYINKPFDVVTIRKAVATALERRSLGSELRKNSEKLGELQSELQQQHLEVAHTRGQSEIYASIIHDINGPLTVISGLLQFINQRVGDETEIHGEDLELVKDRLKRITRQVTNCIEISRRYLGFLRQSPGESFRVRVNQILTDVGDLLRVHPSARNHELIIHPLSEDAIACVNGTDLMQILLNLTLNALQCSPNHHRVEVRGQFIEHSLNLYEFTDGPEDRFLNRETFSNNAPFVALTVQDTGPGIPAEVLPRIFEPYFSTKTRRSGTGLGLSIVQRLVKQASGALHVHTKVGEGTTITVYLPASAGGETTWVNVKRDA